MTESLAVETTEGTGPHAGPPPHYGSVADEYWALTDGAGLLDRSHVGRVSVSGEDALDLLNRLSTNELMTLEAGQGAPTVLTSNKGRILDLLYVFRLEDRLTVLTSPQRNGKVIDWLEFYTIMEDVSVEDRTPNTAMLSFVGPRAAALLDDLTGQDVSSLDVYEGVVATLSGVEAGVYRTDFFSGLPAYDVIVDDDPARRVWEDVLQKGGSVGLLPVGADALEAARVERGVPVYGKELTESYNPLEAGLRKYISFTKGCYVGQEVVARLDTYKKVQRQLVGLRWDSDSDPGENARLLLDGKQVGVVTSAVSSPRLKQAVGLGYVRKAHAEPGTVLAAESENSQMATEVGALPQ